MERRLIGGMSMLWDVTLFESASDFVCFALLDFSLAEFSKSSVTSSKYTEGPGSRYETAIPHDLLIKFGIS